MQFSAGLKRSAVAIFLSATGDSVLTFAAEPESWTELKGRC